MIKIALIPSLQNGKKLICLESLSFQIENFCIPVRYFTVRSVNEHKKAQEKEISHLGKVNYFKELSTAGYYQWDLMQLPRKISC